MLRSGTGTRRIHELFGRVIERAALPPSGGQDVQSLRIDRSLRRFRKSQFIEWNTPVISHLGFDPIWFWMMFLINFTLGGITPPIGYTNFVFKSVAPPETTMSEIMRAAWPIVFLVMGCIALMTLVPEIVTWLPVNINEARGSR